MARITPRGWTVDMAYNDDKAELVVKCQGMSATFDEDECDKLLRVVEYAHDPVGDLAEFFECDFGRHIAWRVAVCFHDHAVSIARHVYEDVTA